MLQFIRDRAQSWIAWVIVGLIIVPFALWGVNQYAGGGQEPVAVSVDGNEITEREIQNGYYQQKQRLQQMFGDNLPANFFSEERLKKQVLEQKIEERVVFGAAVDAKMAIGNRALVQTIHEHEAFQQDGKFSDAVYERLLTQSGMPPGTFEEQLRRDMVLQQYRQSILQSDFNTPLENKNEQLLKSQTRDMGFVKVKADNFISNVEASDAEQRSYYENNQSQFSKPEMVSVKYIELKLSDISKDISIDAQEVQDRYESQKINYRTEEERSASHILIELAEDASDADSASTLERITSIRNDIVNGVSDFASMAKEHSADPGSATDGGALGFFGRGVMDPAFEESAFSLKLGEISEPVRSQFGYHIIKLDDTRGGTTKSRKGNTGID
jgi:peptidyl-prolyl cis-trans isomerase D